MIRIGIGNDTHRLAENENLILGGIEIPHNKGTIGHSDGDALLHSICDAILGALALGDIGTQFPDTDPAFKGVDSKELLRSVLSLMKSKSYRIGNVDSVIMIQKPKMKPHISSMRSVLAEIMEVPEDCVGIKAKTGEGIGIIGREEAVCTQAVVVLQKL